MLPAKMLPGRGSDSLLPLPRRYRGLSGHGEFYGYTPSLGQRRSRKSTAHPYCGGTLTHAATSGLLAGTGLRQVAERSVGMMAALRLAPQ
jgi:hypothetical protein